MAAKHIPKVVDHRADFAVVPYTIVVASKPSLEAIDDLTLKEHYKD